MNVRAADDHRLRATRCGAARPEAPGGRQHEHSPPHPNNSRERRLVAPTGTAAPWLLGQRLAAFENAGGPQPTCAGTRSRRSGGPRRSPLITAITLRLPPQRAHSGHADGACRRLDLLVLDQVGALPATEHSCADTSTRPTGHPDQVITPSPTLLGRTACPPTDQFR
jgi:hypothetical protein